jgi:hypothetical protein
MQNLKIPKISIKREKEEKELDNLLSGPSNVGIC